MIAADESKLSTETVADAKGAGTHYRADRTRTPTKKQQLVRILSVKTGASIVALSTKLGWQPHTTRAALSGLRKAGYEVVSNKGQQGKPARYKIVSVPKGPEVR